MTQSAVKQHYTKIPVNLTKNEFVEFFLPNLSMPKRGPCCKIGYWKVFKHILKVLYTGIQWKEWDCQLNRQLMQFGQLDEKVSR